MKKTLEEIRQANLRDLLDERFEGDIASLSEAIHRGVSTIRKYLSPSLERSINATTARGFERNLGLDTGYLDSEYHGNLTIYYVTLKVSRNFTFDVVQLIQDYPEAVECSAVLGEFDILIKVEVATYHELQVFYDKLSRLPGVQRTKTYPAVESIRWQRQQSANQSLQNPNSFTNYADEYKHQRILEYLDKIRKLETGNILSDDTQLNRVDLNALMLTVRKEFTAIRLHNEIYDNEAAYLAAEQERIADGVVSKRIVTLPTAFTKDPMLQADYNALLETAKCLMGIGSHIRFIFIEEWITNNNNIPECFAVIDNQYVYVKEGDKRSRLLTLHEDLRRYKLSFKVNWERSMSFEDLTSHNSVSH